MNFQEFLTASSTPDFWQQYRSYCFVGTSYPLLWFSKLFNSLKENNILPIPYQRLFLETTERKVIDAALTQSILGNYSFYWCGALPSERETKQGTDLASMLASYDGPHTVAFFVTKPPKNIASHALVITLPQELTPEQIMHLGQTNLLPDDQVKKNFLKNMVQKNVRLDVETCSLLLSHLELIPNAELATASNFLETLTGSAPSLSHLTEQFFAKNAAQFFHLWSKLHHAYPDIFWIFFWAEQTWRAHHVIDALAEKNFVQAKKIGYRLPYAFMNRDWKKSSTKELANAYEFLYHLDYALKTGSTFCALDLFYIKYFTGAFA